MPPTWRTVLQPEQCLAGTHPLEEPHARGVERVERLRVHRTERRDVEQQDVGGGVRRHGVVNAAG